MTITSLIFLLFVFFTLIVYYILPKRFQWVVLLISSLCFYVISSTWGITFVLITSISTYFATIGMDKIKKASKEKLQLYKGVYTKEQKKALKIKTQNKRKAIMIATLVLNFGILCVFKYSHFALEQFNGIRGLFELKAIEDNINLPLVLGISFYTFQTMGYLVECYWDTVDVQKNYFKLLLFVSFFPQVTQGPISNYAQLSNELFTEHNLDYTNFSRGFQRLVWGFVKKMIIADFLHAMVYGVFGNYDEYIGLACLAAAFGYSIQIYADFSGYMDIMCGLCEMFGIKLAENFQRPYFSKSIAEYWRRWHITLGEWFKNYIYYPIGVSKWNRNLGKKLSKRFGKTISKNLPATIALVIVWLTTGLWHGASWAYIAWGLVNGLFIIFSMWMEPVYDKTKSALHIKENSFAWRATQVIRTFILVTFIKVLPEVGKLSDGFGLLSKAVTNFTAPSSFYDIFPTLSEDNMIDFYIVLAFIVILFITSLMQRKKPIRDYFNKTPAVLRIVILAAILILAFAFEGDFIDIDGGDFMYAQF